MRTLSLQVVIWLMISTPAIAQVAPGDVDPTFVYPRPSVLVPDSTNAVPLPDGWLVVQSTLAPSAVEPALLVLTRTDADGRIDVTFGTLGRQTVQMPENVNVSLAAKRLADGSILLAGFRPAAGGDKGVGIIARLGPRGQLDPAFGTAGVAALDVPGELDRVGAIDVLPDGRVVALLWSRTQYNYYDCSFSQATLVTLSADGQAPWTEFQQQRDSWGTSSCRTQLTLQVRADGSTLVGTELGIFQDGAALLPGNWRYGPFVMDAQLGSFYTTVDGSRIGVQALFSGWPQVFDDYQDLGSSVGFTNTITWTRMVADAARRVLYLGFASDGGQVAVVRFLDNGAVDTGWAGGDGLVAIQGAGRPGVPALDGLATELRVLHVEPDGDIVIVTADGIVQRLAGGSGPAHGAFVLRSPEDLNGEGNYKVSVPVGRVGGSTGAVSVNYAVRSCDPIAGPECSSTEGWGDAKDGEDFVAATGRLDWANGDAVARYIGVELLDDTVAEPMEFLYVELFDPTGGAGVLSGPQKIYINASDPTLTQPAARPEVRSGGGSGRAGRELALLLLFAAAARLVRRRRAVPYVDGTHCS